MVFVPLVVLDCVALSAPFVPELLRIGVLPPCEVALPVLYLVRPVLFKSLLLIPILRPLLLATALFLTNALRPVLPLELTEPLGP
jgi:hypothetical protein